MKTIVVVSDLHCGSVFGLQPPPEMLELSDDRSVNLNAGQKYLWECWKDFCDRMGKLKPDVVIFNGDMIDGEGRKNRGVECSLPMLADQCEAARVCIEYLLKKCGKPPIYFTAGTEYHVGAAAREEEDVARSLGATLYRGLGTGRYVKEVLDLEVDGVILNFAHHGGTAGGFYRATMADREGIWSALAGKEGKSPKADHVGRAHAHCFVHLEHPSKHITYGPCWQLQTRFMRHGSVYRMIPDIGGYVILVDGAAKRAGGDPITVQKVMYSLPPYTTTKL